MFTKNRKELKKVVGVCLSYAALILQTQALEKAQKELDLLKSVETQAWEELTRI